ncbi:hypothetical protein [Microcystis phage Mae-JY22]
MSTKSRAVTPPESFQGSTGGRRVWLADHSKSLGAFMPLKLKAVMREFLITNGRLAAGVCKRDGSPFSASAISELINHGLWPRLTAVDSVQTQIRERLAELGVPADRLGELFEVDQTELAMGAEGSMLASAATRPAARKAARASADAAAPNPEDEIPPVEPDMLSPEARRHFSFFRDPFSDEIHAADDVFVSPDIRYVQEVVFQTAKVGGMVAVVGESGAGKSVIRRDLIDRIQRERAQIHVIQPRVIDKGALTARHICEAILQDMAPNTTMSTSLERLARQVEKVLVASSRGGHTHALVIEEAHDLAINALKYLKRFWELEDGFRKLLAIILVGQPELGDKLDERVNYAAREVIRRCEIARLHPLGTQLEAYLTHKLARVGKKFDEIFDPSAMDAIRARLTSGRRSQLYPLTVNNLVTRALNRAALDCAPTVSASTIYDLTRDDQ